MCRSSALASKATGFPIAKMATKLAMGMTLDQIPNDITQCASHLQHPQQSAACQAGCPAGCLHSVDRNVTNAAL
ncbi:MAG: hypothetical protein HC767_00130 [Akkermansiaceae bacterium]|nr:hypothetical protein [Akkermansiaceae bacterium]